MKFTKSLVAVAVASLFAVGVAFAAEAKKEEAKKASCCVKAAKDGKTCDHACCGEAAKKGENCGKCGGSGKVEVKK